MRISTELTPSVPAITTFRCKQRLVTISEVFKVDLAFCLSRQGDEWSVLAVDGPLATADWSELLPLHNLEMTAAGGRGVRTMECVGSAAQLVSTVSQISADGRTIFVAVKFVENGVYAKEALRALRRHLEVFAFAGI